MRRLLSTLFAAAAVVAGPAVADCTCRSPSGEARPLGSDICMTADGGPATYRCSMVQNVTSWRKVGEGCPQARAAAPGPEEEHPEDAPVRIAAVGE